MEKTDRQTDTSVKSTRWAFTAYEKQWELFNVMPPGIAEWGWQKEECPETKKLHYQGYLRTNAQQRLSWFSRVLPGVHIEKCGWKTPDKPQAQCWLALVNYCKKKDTAVDGIHHYTTSTYYTIYTYAEECGKSIYKQHYLTYKTWSDEVAWQQIKDQALYDLQQGHREIMWIIANPNWKLAWKAWKQILASYEAEFPELKSPTEV